MKSPPHVPSHAREKRWSAQQAFSVFGTRYLLRTDRPAVLQDLVEQLPHGCLRRDGDAAPPHHTFTVRFSNPSGALARLAFDTRCTNSCDDAGSLIEHFRNFVLNGVCKTARDRVLIHAGVVAWRGRAILLPARSTHGKSTLVQHFLQAGFTYFSDEFAVLDADGWIHPYARPLHLRLVPGSLAQTAFTAEELGAKAVGGEALLPALMLACRYSSGARWKPRPLTQGAMALELTRHCTTARRFPQTAFRAITQAAAHMQGWRGLRGEAREVVAWTLRMLDAEPAQAEALLI